MPTLPAELSPLVAEFAPLFSKPVWEHAKALLAAAILTIGQRTVTACLRVMGKSQGAHFQNYHRVLNRARWTALTAGNILLGLLVTTFAPRDELIFGTDDTIERRRGQKIKAKGIYRDPVRSSHSHFVKSSALALALLYIAGQDSLGRSDLGAALPDRLVPIAALSF